jgi:dephospho-CoA kinase
LVGDRAGRVVRSHDAKPRGRLAYQDLPGIAGRRFGSMTVGYPGAAGLYRVGLTGSIASGKSVVADEWARLGAAVVDADGLAREVVEPGTIGLERVRAEFGEQVVAADGTVDRAALRRIVFADDVKRKAVEAILHPEIARLRTARESTLAEQGERIVVHVIPLLFETGMQAGFDAIVLVDSPADVRLDRLVRLRGLKEDQARAMIEAQMTIDRKREALGGATAAPFVIENDGTLDELREQARHTWRQIVEKAEAQ